MNRRTLDGQCHHEKLAVVQKSSNFKVSKRCGLLLIGWLVLKWCFKYGSIKGSRSVVAFSAGSRPRDKRRGGGGGSSIPLDKEGARPPQNFFGPFGPQFGLKIRGWGGGGLAPPLDPPRVSPLHDHCNTIVYFCTCPLHPPPSLQKSCTTQC